MGAATTEVRADSTDVLLEAAVWDPAGVSRTQRRLHLPSEAARRYERAVDPAISVAALDRCAALLADIAGGAVSDTLTDWRGDPPRADWSMPAIRIAADLPDRVAGVAYAPGATARRLAQIGAAVTENGRHVDRDPAELASRSPTARRPCRRGAAAGGPGGDPVGVAGSPRGPGTDRGAKAPARDRKVVGAVRVRRGAADTVSARRCVRPVGAAGRRPAAHHDARRQPAGGRPSGAGHHPAARPTRSAGAQRIPRPGRCRAVCHRAGGPAHRADSSVST